MEFSARELEIYRVGNATAILCAGLALKIGYRAAYLIDALLGLFCLGLACRLQEAETSEGQFEGSIAERILRVFRESLGFLVRGGKALGLMLFNSLVGAVCILTVFFMQARLPRAGVSGALLGPAMFAISMGGAFGARISSRLGKWKFSGVALLCVGGALLGAAFGMGNRALLMCVGGFGANLCSDLLEVRVDAMLNEAFPSAQRSTLLSVASLVFSLVMIVLSPLAGLVFE